MMPMNNNMMNNPVMAIMNVAKSGGNPMSLVQQMAKSDPTMAQAMNIIHGKSPEQLKSICMNMCRERGVSPAQIAQQLGIPMK